MFAEAWLRPVINVTSCVVGLPCSILY